MPNVLQKAQILVDPAASGRGNLFIMSRASGMQSRRAWWSNLLSWSLTSRLLPSSMGGIGVVGGGMGGVDVWCGGVCVVSDVYVR